MRINRYKQVLLAVVTCFCLLCLGLPLFYLRWSNTQLTDKGTVRPQQPGMLSKAGQEHPLVYALYRSRFAAQSALELPGDALQIQQELQTKTDALAEAGALPDLVARRARWIWNNRYRRLPANPKTGLPVPPT